jgi:hypothetical protein
MSVAREQILNKQEQTAVLGNGSVNTFPLTRLAYENERCVLYEGRAEEL